nr:chemotaxis protein CheB [Mucilaginibacter aquariorum]
MLIVGIGASAGGLEALKVFFEHAPANSSMAFVIVQHLDPRHKSLLAELISGHTKMMVREIVNGDKVKPDHVYVIPPNKSLTIEKQKLLLTGPAADRAERRPIDGFFRSLAADQQENAAGIVLSGTGTEGALGLQAIKAAGGITMVQEPETAQFDGMPRSAIAAGAADLVLPPEQMAEQLSKLMGKEKLPAVPVDAELSGQLEEKLSKIFQIIRAQTGYDFSNYKLNTIARRINKRIALNKFTTLAEYARFLKDHPEEVTRLYKDFLIGVTSFFRDSDAFKRLQEQAVPLLLEQSGDKQELRAWVCGCSTGEEAYSLAILLKEALDSNKQYVKVTVFASDIDEAAIEFARLGIYSESAAAQISPERLSKYFIKNEHGYQVKKDVREMVVFAHHNLLKDPPFSKLDLISCRNLLIYIKSELQKKIIPLFHYSLNDDGWLFLGTSESIGEYTGLFTTIDAKYKLFRKKNGHAKRPSPLLELPFIGDKLVSARKGAATASPKAAPVPAAAEQPAAESPPSVIIDKNNDALYFSGPIAIYLSPPNGVAKWNILEMAGKELRTHLKNSIKKARKNKTAVQKNHLEIAGNNGVRQFNLHIKPLLTRKYDSGTLMVVFEPADLPETPPAAGSIKKTNRNSRLENELQLTRADLQAAVHDLASANEDLQSVNEELQSTNEELETSREELQSLNEELITVNTELTGKIDQLSQSNNDLNNLLRSIEVATVYLDRKLRVKRFTPAATKIFNLIPADIGRPLTQLKLNLHYDNLADDVSHALKTLETRSVEVSGSDGTWYYMRIIPYRTSENMIEGVLITLVDISSQKAVEHDLAKSNEHLNLVMENLPAVPYTCTMAPELEFSFVGKSCEKVTGFLPGQFTGKTAFWMQRIHPDDQQKMSTAFAGIAKKGNDEQNFRWKCANGKYKQFINTIRYTAARPGKPAYIAGVWQEVLSAKSAIKNKSS